MFQPFQIDAAVGEIYTKFTRLGEYLSCVPISDCPKLKIQIMADKYEELVSKRSPSFKIPQKWRSPP
jgi:hypothetical protein